MVEYSGPFLQLDDLALDHILNSTTGDVGGHMRRIGLQILERARRMVPTRTGHLRASLYSRHDRRGKFQYVQVGSNLHYALDVHEGTRPHLIVPHHSRMLRFNVGGRVIFAHQVHSPGSRGKKYLTIPLAEAVRR